MFRNIKEFSFLNVRFVVKHAKAIRNTLLCSFNTAGDQ